MVGFGTTQTILAIRQPEEMLISLGRGLVPWLCGVFERHPHERQKNQGC